MSYAQRDKRTNKLTGRWRADAQYRHADGSVTTWRKTFESKSEADGAEAYYRATGNPPPHLIGLQAPTSSFRAVAERFRDRHPEYFKVHHSNGQRFDVVVERLGNYDIKQVRHKELEDLVDYLRTRPASHGKAKASQTIRHYLIAVFKVLDYAHKLDLIPGLPKRPALAVDAVARNAFTRPQERAVLAAMEVRGAVWEAFYMRVLLATGMRCGELDALSPEQVELPEQEDNTGVMLRAEQTKTNAARWVPIVPEIARKLKHAIAMGTLPKRAQVYEVFHRVRKVTGDAAGLTLHSCRHTTVTRLMESGADSIDVAEIVGHKTGRMTSRYYHPDKAHLFRVAEKVQRTPGEMGSIDTVVPLKPLEKSA